jgi:Esterase PHB depolymerase
MKSRVLGFPAICSAALVGACGGSPATGATGDAAAEAGPAPAGASGMAGAAGVPGQAGVAGVAGGGALAGAAGAAGPHQNYGGIVGLEDLSTVKTSQGCGKDPTQPLGAWQPMESPAPGSDPQSGYSFITPNTPRGSFTRHYFVKLPKAYDENKPYRAIYLGPGCGGSGVDTPPFDIEANATPDAPNDVHGHGVILIGLSPCEDVANDCFDDQSGAGTIEKAFIEGLFPDVASRFCLDEHRVFAAGHASGGWLADQLGHVYGSRLFRAVAPSAGGLAVGSALQPCLGAGLPGATTSVGGCLAVPGIWFHDVNDPMNPYTGARDAITAALMSNNCTGSTFDAGPTTMLASTEQETCVQYTGCPAQFPIARCSSTTLGAGNPFDETENRQIVWSFFREF